MTTKNREFERIRAVTMVNDGMAPSIVAKKLGHSRKWVYGWLARSENKENETVPWYQERERSGRPTLAEPVKKTIIKNVKYQDYKSVRRVAEQMCGKGVPISKSTVFNVLKEADLHPYRYPTAPALKPTQKAKRVVFAKANLSRDWSRTLFTDEKDFELFGSGNRQNDRFWSDDRSNVPIHAKYKHPPKVKVWAGISPAGKVPPVFYKEDYCNGTNGGMTGTDFAQMLEEKVLPECRKLFGQDGDWTFLQDGASPHTAAVAMTLLEEEGMEIISGGVKGVFPSDSPDLNPMENVWAIMQEELVRRDPKTVAEAKRALKSIWKNLDLKLIRAMSDGMGNRMAEVIRLKGETINV